MGFECIDVEKLYARDSKLKKEDVQIIQEWLKKQPHLPRLKDMQVVMFLHSCYYRIEAAKKTIDNYFTMRTHYPEIFTSLSEIALRNALSVSFISILPKKTPQGYAIMLLKLLDFNVDKYNFCDSVTVISMVSTLYMHQHGFEKGGIIVFDCQGFTLSHLARFNLSVLKHALDQVQEGAPVRIKGIHFINIVPILDKVMAIIKPLVKNEIFNMLQLHSSLDAFYKYVSKDCMPSDYDGNIPSCQILSEENIKNLFDNFEFFKWHDAQKVDESKRLGKTNCSFGVEGTFKKLEID